MRSKEESLAEFHRVFDSKETFLKQLWERKGSTCFCGSSDFVYSNNLRSRYCARKHRCSITADTPFRNSKKVLPLAMALWLASDGILISGNELAELNDIEESSAWMILKKVSFLALALLKLGVRAPAEAFADAIGRRSIATPPYVHPRAELGASTDEELVGSPELQRLAIAQTLNAIVEVHQRISRKYLQLFAATMVFIAEEFEFNDLMRAIGHMRSVRLVDVLSYVSPPSIELMPIPSD